MSDRSATAVRNSPLVDPRDAVMRTMERIYQYRMTTTSGGNISLREANGDIWITPARVDKGRLTREDIICIHPDRRIEGRHPASSEFPFHQAIYAARPDIRAVVHAHPVALVAFSMCREAPNTRLLYQTRDVCGEVTIAKYALPSSAALGTAIAGEFARGSNCVVLENHGVVTGGDDLPQAFQRFETLEFAAKIMIKGRMLGPLQYLTDAQLALAKRSSGALPFFQRDPVSGAENERRRELVDFVRRGYRQRLMISTGGSFSARLDDRAFLITPYRVDRHTVDIDDIVLVRDGAAEEGKCPSRASLRHAAIYKKHPGVQAIVNAYTVNATAFSVTGTPLDSRTIPESYVLLRRVGRIAYGPQFTDLAAVASAVSLDNPALLLENDGVLVCGTSVLDAFDRLEVLESTAEAIINARHLGAIVPMEDAALADLERAFLQKKC